MTTQSDGGPAFPKPLDPYPNIQASHRPGDVGMSLRDYFAAAALQGMLCNGFVPNDFATGNGYHVAAYALADAMLAERQKAGATNV